MVSGVMSGLLHDKEEARTTGQDPLCCGHEITSFFKSSPNLDPATIRHLIQQLFPTQNPRIRCSCIYPSIIYPAYLFRVIRKLEPVAADFEGEAG